MDMGLVNMAVNFKQATTMSDISTAILAKALDTGRDMGQGMVELIDSAAMERSVNPMVGGNIDISV
ncbi:MAG: YjfB family protein [Lachnospiraceae bacterium]|jgi:hypothetical protein|nr:YjfB family protein [Lachnospiraceae bacterium]MBO7095478.1 YjfB family protein [Lachnospiraceae bacterium]MBO7531390.1 YjfB family protein [Lachnospiraceae bacterium]MCR5441156.1 YjfB family protein [Lachnospiraceae bacterium]